jgi:hypothetical protein
LQYRLRYGSQKIAVAALLQQLDQRPKRQAGRPIIPRRC